MTPVLTYVRRFEASGMSPQDFARHALARWHDLCLMVMEEVGSWPSSEPELAALQAIYR